MTSANNTIISLPGQFIADTTGNVWAIVSGQVTVNGALDPTTRNVIEVAYENGIIWQKNTDNLWWSKSSPAAAWDPPYGTSVDPVPDQAASANDTIVTVIPGSTATAITDGSGNFWSIAAGQVTLDGVADPTTARVIELAYVNGNIWQENADHLWWSKSKPSDAWGPTYGQSTSPVADVARSWIGGSGSFATPGDWTPSGVPQAGDTAIIASGQVSVPAGFMSGVNLDLQGGEIEFTVSGTFNTGTWSGSGRVLVGYPAQAVSVTNTGILMNGGLLNINQFISSTGGLAIHGNSMVAGGAVLDAQLVGTGSLPRAPIENDGTMTINGSTVEVGELTGQGTLRAVGDSSLSVISASAGETIQLVSAHLYIGGGPIPSSTALQFLAPITGFGAGSEITLNNTVATSAMFAKSGPRAGEMLLYNGANRVADLHIRGQAQIYASSPAGSGPPSVLLTAFDTGHSIALPSS